MESRFEKAIQLMRRAGYGDISERLRREAEGMAADTYKIAVVGEFKTCKSTLINKVFLKEDVLFTDVMEATAVPTEIRYSPDKYLEITPYEKKIHEKPNPFENGEVERIEEIQDEGAPIKIADQGPDDIRKHTAAATSEQRGELAGKTARVRLGWPSVNLAGLTVFDTPGINSINEAVIATTYRIIPESDLVLFLTTARQLSEIELEFLTGRVLSEGVARVMTVVTYDPRTGVLTEKQRQNLLDAVRGQLAGIGQKDIPVEMVNIRDRPDTSGSSPGFRDRIDSAAAKGDSRDHRQAVDSVIGGLLGEKGAARRNEAVDWDDDESIGVAALEEKLIRFIRENVRPARIEKADRVLKKQLQLATVRCSTEMAALGKSESERGRLLENFKQREGLVRRENDALSAQLRDDLSRVRTQTSAAVARGLDRIAKSYTDGFDQCDNMGDLQDRLHRAEVLLKKDIEALFVEISGQIREQMETLSESYQIKSQGLLSPWRAEICRDLAIDGGVLANVPPFAILALDFSLFVIFGPFRPLARIIVRLLANEIPFLNKILPASVAASLLKNNIKRSLMQQFEQLKKDMTLNMEKAFDQVAENLLNEWSRDAEEQLNSVRAGLEQAVGLPDNQQRLAALSSVKTDLEKILACPAG